MDTCCGIKVLRVSQVSQVAVSCGHDCGGWYQLCLSYHYDLGFYTFFLWHRARSKLGRPLFIYSNCMRRHSLEPEPRNLSGDEDGHLSSSRVVRQRLEVQEGGLMVVHTAVQVKCKRIYALSLSLSHTHTHIF